MVCNNCGASLPEASAFCPNCGSPAEQPQADNTVYQESAYSAQYNYNTPYQATAEQGALSKSILIFGILSLALSEFGIIGLIFAIIAKNKIGKYIPQYGAPVGSAKVGKILSTIGLILSIIYTVVWSIYFIIFIVALVAGTMVA